MKSTNILPVLVATLTSGCVASPMFIGPPRTLTTDDVRLSAGAAWKKPVDSGSVGAPQVDGALHLNVSEGFDLAGRVWSSGAGMQGRLAVASRDRGAAVNFMLAPLLGVSAAVGLKQEDRFLPPIEAEFLMQLPVILGFGLGTCELFVGGDPIAHLKPGRAVLRAGGSLGFACPTETGSWIAPEIGFEAPVIGGGDLRPENGFEQGVPRPPLFSNVVRAGVSFSF